MAPAGTDNDPPVGCRSAIAQWMKLPPGASGSRMTTTISLVPPGSPVARRGGGVSGILPKLKGGPPRLDDGKQAGITIPNFQNIDKKTQRKDFIRGYVMNATGGQTDFPQFAANVPGYGSAWKKEIKSRYVAQA